MIVARIEHQGVSRGVTSDELARLNDAELIDWYDDHGVVYPFREVSWADIYRAPDIETPTPPERG